ncbi:hypothetical protein [Leifsonia sp. NPDC058248]|uniref:hypothetical protein n=1 Tax=Leifsonia sp. NPDC058248 TaxID=3346402 RepID=UPI0036D89579
MTVLSEAPAGAQVLDLDAARAARAEARAAAGDPSPYIKVSGGFVAVRPEIDVLAAEDLQSGRLREGLSKLLADPADIDTLVAGGVTQADLELLTNLITGLTPGE